MKKTVFSAIAVLVVIATVLTVTVFAGSDIRVYVNGIRVEHDVILSNDRTYLPVRAVGEAMGADVVWDEQSRSVFISFTEEDMVSKIVETVSPSVVTIVGNYSYDKKTDEYNNLTSHGSGVIYKSNGYIITNAHVVDGIKNTTVILNDGSSYPAKVLCSDTESDLAIVKIDKIGLTPVTMADYETVCSGKTAIALGTPISLSMRNTVTKGIVSGRDVVIESSYYKLIQTDAAINPGNSGGPLVNSKGELIGINSVKYTGTDVDNAGFAIPVDTVRYVINQYEKNGKVIRPNLGVTLEESWEAKIGLPTTKGITVKQSANDKFQAYDVITSVNGINVHGIADLNEAIKDTFDGHSISIGYIRSGENFVADILY